MDREDLNEFIGYNLHELAWRKDYPLNKGIAGWGIINGLKKTGFNVVSVKDKYRIFRVFNYGKKNYSLAIDISNKELLAGWNQNPEASPRALYNSIYNIIDKFDDQVKSHFPKWKVPRDLSEYLFNQRRFLAVRARKAMEESFLEYFNKYQEGVLAPLNGKEINKLKPKILDELIDSEIIDLERINQAITDFQFKGSGFGNSYSTVAFLKDGKPLDEDFVIGESRVLDYVWGGFLLKLAKLKGYGIKEYELDETFYGMLEIACERGWGILKELRIKETNQKQIKNINNL